MNNTLPYYSPIAAKHRFDTISNSFLAKARVSSHFFKVNEMNLQVAEKTDIRTVQTIIDEAKALGLRVVHRPDHVKTNVVSLDARRQMMAHTSPEAA